MLFMDCVHNHVQRYVIYKNTQHTILFQVKIKLNHWCWLFLYSSFQLFFPLQMWISHKSRVTTLQLIWVHRKGDLYTSIAPTQHSHSLSHFLRFIRLLGNENTNTSMSCQVRVYSNYICGFCCLSTLLNINNQLVWAYWLLETRYGLHL